MQPTMAHLHEGTAYTAQHGAQREAQRAQSVGTVKHSMGPNARPNLHSVHSTEAEACATWGAAQWALLDAQPNS